MTDSLRINTIVDLSATADGQVSDWLSVDLATANTGNVNRGMIYIIATGNATADIMVEVRPSPGRSAALPASSQCDAFRSPISITADKRTIAGDFNIAKGMEVRSKVTNFTTTDSGSIRVCIDLGVS